MTWKNPWGKFSTCTRCGGIITYGIKYDSRGNPYHPECRLYEYEPRKD